MISDQQIAMMYGEGMSIRDIAGAYGLSKQRVSSALQRADVPRRTHKEAGRTPAALAKAGRTDTRTEARAITMHESGASIVQISDELGLSHTTVARILDRYDAVRRGSGWSRTPPDVEQQAIEMYRDGHSTEVVGRALGVSSTAVAKILERHGVPRRPRRQFGSGEEEMHEREAAEGDEEPALICMGRDVVMELDGDCDDIELPERWGMLHDPSGELWPKCSLLFMHFRQGSERDDSDEGVGYFGKRADVRRGKIARMPLPDLHHGWHEVGIVKQVFYERAGRHAGRFRHKFNDPRGWMWLVALFKRRVAETPPVLFEYDRGGLQALRLELPDGCAVDDRGIALP